MIPQSAIEQDVDLIMWSMRLCTVLRYHEQFFWQTETKRTLAALELDAKTEDGIAVPRSESVADHSWHMADMVLLLGPRFPELDIGRCVMLAVIHDKLEIITGDYDPTGQNGTGHDAHAFNAQKKDAKDAAEKQAMTNYLSRVNDGARALQETLLQEAMHLQSLESRFIKALDRLQVFAYVIQRKAGVVDDAMIIFMLKYLSSCNTHFPPIKPYYDCFVRRLLESIADRRGVLVQALQTQFNTMSYVA